MPAPADLVHGLGARLGRLIGRRPAVLFGGVAAGAAALGAVARSLGTRPSRPTPGAIAAAAADAVWDASKGAVIEAARLEIPEPTTEQIASTVRGAVFEAAAAGVDVTSAVLGAVEGAMAVAHLASDAPSAVADAAAAAALGAAVAIGPDAGLRAREALAATYPGLAEQIGEVPPARRPDAPVI